MKPNLISPSEIKAKINMLTTTKSEGDMRLLENREKIKLELGLDHLHWLKQVHGKDIIRLINKNTGTPEADGFITAKKNIACAIITADCLPIVIYNDNAFAVIHAGWRGIYAGIIEAAVEQLHSNTKDCHVWFGPAISQAHYEVDAEFKKRFIALDPDLEAAFAGSQCSLTTLARIKLEKMGVPTHHILGGEYCTYRDNTLFYSHRRERDQSGRIATVVWLS